MIAERVLRLPRRTKSVLLAALDGLALPVALWLALALRLGDWQIDAWRFWPAFLAALTALPVLASLGLYGQVNRYMGAKAVPIAAKGAAVGAVAVAVAAYFIPLTGFPRSVPFIFWMVAVLQVAGSRLLIQAAFTRALSEARDLQIADLLGRTEVAPLPDLLSKSVAGRQVMVTGAGGSIGSELCRRIVRQGPKQLALLDHSEFSLFRVLREIKQICADERLDVPVVGLLGSVANRAFMRHNLAAFGVETLYHAAAYKHIDLVENNSVEGLKNNTFGTLYTAEEAMRAKVKDFILISTDKAVRTSSVMGASKRLAEMALQALQQQSRHTCFSIVRFGNVLNSSGSVVPLFLEQIERGGPITVTHREVTRYFMTIREAAELVMQAASMARGGDVFLLEMGAPIRILDLATKMAHLKGYSIRSEANPDGGLEIRFTGLKRGEKLHEDLLAGQDISGTDHRNIMRAEERFLPWPELRRLLDPLQRACDSYDHRVIHLFAEGLAKGVELEAILKEVAALAAAPSQASVTALPVGRGRA